MSRKKSFTSEALSTITGTPTTKKEIKPTLDTPEAKKSRTTAVNRPKRKSTVQPITSRNTTRTGKAVTLYLNTENYRLFKERAKEEETSASYLINEFIRDYIS